MQPIFIACTAGVMDGKARCRNERGKCSVHARPEYWSPAPTPTAIILKVNVNERWERRLLAAGITIQTRTYDRALQLEERRVASASALGRNAYSVRELSGRDSHHTPESADTGCPVFGKAGLSEMKVSVKDLVDEFFAAGFVLTGAHLLRREHKPPVRLVLEFSRPSSKPELVRFPWSTVHELLATTFDQIDVWANETAADGKTVHTVNCGRRADGAAPKLRLRYAGGMWEVQEVAVS